MGIGQAIMDEYNARPACPVCGRRFVPLADGNIRRHVRERGGGTLFTERCPGSGRKPKPRISEQGANVATAENPN